MTKCPKCGRKLTKMNLNKVFVIGNLTKDPELKMTPSGAKVCSFGVATNRVWYNKDTQEKNQEVEFHNIVAWGKTAELIVQYMTKGSSILIEGRLQTRSWEGKDGKKNYRTEIVAEQMQFGLRPQVTVAPRREEAPSDDLEASLEVPPASAENTASDINVEDIPF